LRARFEKERFYPLFSLIAIVFICLFIGHLVTTFSPVVPLALILTAGIAIATLVNIEVSLTIMIFSMLLSPEIVLGQVPGRDINLRFEDILLAIITFSWLIKAAINKERALFKKTPFNGPMLAYTSACLISTLRGAAQGFVSPTAGFFYVLKYIEYFLLFILVANHIESKKQIIFYLKAFFVTCIIVSAYGIWQIPSGVRVSAPFEGDIGEPNTFGGYLLFMLCLAIGLILHKIPQKYKLLLIGTCGLIILPFFYTLSRASYLGIIFSFFAFIILSPKKLPLIVTMMAILLAVLIFRPQAVLARVESTFQEEATQTETVGKVKLDPSASARIFSWKLAIQAWTFTPVVGRGVTGYAFIDGQYIRTLPELGLLGLFALLWLFWQIFKSARRIYHQAEDDLAKGLSLGFLAGFIGLCTHALTANTFIIIRIMEPFWFIAGIVVMLPQLKKEDAGEVEDQKLQATLIGR